MCNNAQENAKKKRIEVAQLFEVRKQNFKNNKDKNQPTLKMQSKKKHKVYVLF